MGTFHLEVADWEADPSGALGEIASKDPACGHYASQAYQFARDLFSPHKARAAISGGVLPLADGGSSVTLSISAFVGPASELSYRDRIMELVRQGPEPELLCTRPQPDGGKCTKPYAHTDECNSIGGVPTP